MRRIGFICAVLGALGALSPHTALAQLNDTSYVASDGDDANICNNPTNACRFLPRAHDRTNAGGKIFILDSGTFAGNGLVITKAISVVAKGVQAQLTGTGVIDKIVVNAGPSDVVHIDGLHILGVHNPNESNGILFNSGSELHVRNCLINGFPGTGIRLRAPGPSKVIISDCMIFDNKFGVTARRVGGSGQLQVLLDDVTIAGNEIGVNANQNATRVRINSSKIVDNGTGLLSQNNGRLISFGNNVIAHNGTNGAPTATESLN